MEVVKEVPPIEREGLTKYLWDSIFDGKLNKLTKGKDGKGDFECSAVSFASNARQAATRLGVKLEICKTRGNEVYIQSKK